MRVVTVLILFAMLIPFSYAEISFNSLYENYNIGEHLTAEVLVDAVFNFSGFQSADIICDPYSMNYFKTPISIETTASLPLPPLKLIPEMKGKCKLHFALINNDGTIKEEKTSNEFTVSDELILFLNAKGGTVEPGKILNLAGTIYNQRQEGVSADMTVKLGDTATNFEVAENFAVDYKIPPDIPAGEKKLILMFHDGNNNYVDRVLTIQVIQKPTKIEIATTKLHYLPGDEFKAIITLLDQSDSPINTNVEVTISKDGKTYFNEKISGSLGYQITNLLEPGDYVVEANFDSIYQKLIFTVDEQKKITSTVDNGILTIRNTGNVKYADDVTVKIGSGEKQTEINKDISLYPDETYEIDLTKEVKEGAYEITLPEGSTLSAVNITDNRNMLKKVLDGFGSVTGFVTHFVPDSKFNQGWLILFLVAIVGLAVIFYAGRPIVSTITKVTRRAYKRVRNTKLLSKRR